MNMLFSSIIGNQDQTVTIVKKLVDLLGIKITSTTLRKDLENHPDYPSLLSISDVLTSHGIENIALIVRQEKMHELPLPFVAQIKDDTGQNMLAAIQTLTPARVTYYHARKSACQSITTPEFEKRWPSGIALLVDPEKACNEKDYTLKSREEQRKLLARMTMFSALPLLGLAVCISALLSSPGTSFLPVLFTMLTLAGCITGCLLLLHELDTFNPLLQQICTAGKKINCAAILDSKAAKIMGISWSAVGFIYFMGAFLLLLITGITNHSTLFILSWLNVFAVPYIFYSIYYQWRIAKQWCILCLTVQGLLVLQCATAIVAGLHTVVSLNTLFSSTIIFSFVTAYMLPFIIITLLLPAYRAAKGSRNNKMELQRLKNNSQIFEALLQKQKAIIENPEGVGILLGNPNATNKLIKVCNPYCGPCAKAHVAMDQLLHNNPDLQIQIIFTATNNEQDKRALPAKHLLAIAERNNNTLTEAALNDWYRAEEKDYAAFFAKYPMNGELQQQTNKIEAMNDWCKKTDITFTPTFFVNGHQLPEMYTVNDLKYLLQTSCPGL